MSDYIPNNRENPLEGLVYAIIDVLKMEFDTQRRDGLRRGLDTVWDNYVRWKEKAQPEENKSNDSFQDVFSWRNCNKPPYLCDKSCLIECKNWAAWKERNPQPKPQSEKPHIVHNLPKAGIYEYTPPQAENKPDYSEAEKNLLKNFELKPQPQKEEQRIEIMDLHIILKDGSYLKTEKYKECKQAIEQVLNDDKFSDRPAFSPKQVDELCEKAACGFIHYTEFVMDKDDWMAKGNMRSMGEVYQDFIKWKNSKQ